MMPPEPSEAVTFQRIDLSRDVGELNTIEPEYRPERFEGFVEEYAHEVAHRFVAMVLFTIRSTYPEKGRLSYLKQIIATANSFQHCLRRELQILLVTRINSSDPINIAKDGTLYLNGIAQKYESCPEANTISHIGQTLENAFKELSQQEQFPHLAGTFLTAFNERAEYSWLPEAKDDGLERAIRGSLLRSPGSYRSLWAPDDIPDQTTPATEPQLERFKDAFKSVVHDTSFLETYVVRRRAFGGTEAAKSTPRQLRPEIAAAMTTYYHNRDSGLQPDRLH